MNQPKDNPFTEMFNDPEQVGRYAENPPRFMPGFWDLHKMTSVLISEKAPANAKVLVLGAGGGLELEALANAHPNWTFVGVDPAQEMLREAERRLGPLAQRVEFHCGFINDAPDGPFDAATSLLTLHFLEKDDRQKTLSEINRRLKPGAPLVAAHLSFPQDEEARATWLSRHIAFAMASGVDQEHADQARAGIEAMPTLYDPDTDSALLRNAGFRDVSQFYQALAWRGWVAYAS